MWNQRFSSAEYVYGFEPNDFLREQYSAFPKGGRVLCVGDGEGRNGVFLAQQGLAVTSVDYAEAGLEKAQRLAKERGAALETVHADLATLAIEEGAYAGIVSIFCHLPPSIRRAVHQKLARSLAPGGRLVLEAYRHEQLRFGTGGPKDLALLYRLEDLREDFEGLHFLIARNVEREVVEGKLHTGLAATVQIVASR